MIPQLNASIFKLDAHVLHLEIVHRSLKDKLVMSKFVIDLKPGVCQKGVAIACFLMLYGSFELSLKFFLFL